MSSLWALKLVHTSSYPDETQIPESFSPGNFIQYVQGQVVEFPFLISLDNVDVTAGTIQGDKGLQYLLTQECHHNFPEQTALYYHGPTDKTHTASTTALLTPFSITT
jgi:hypothetical protein